MHSQKCGRLTVMSEETIGRGTWYDMMAKKVIDRENQLGRSMKLVRTEMGLGASGFHTSVA